MTMVWKRMNDNKGMYFMENNTRKEKKKELSLLRIIA